MRRRFVVLWVVLASALVSPGWGQTASTEFVPVTPCRIVDSRIGQGAVGPLMPGATHGVFFRSSCGIPGLTNDGGNEVNRATAIAMNIVAVSPAGFGHLIAWPSNRPIPGASVINYSPGQNIANGVVVAMCDQEATIPCPSGDISFLAGVSSTHLVVDVTGYYIKPHEEGSGRHGAGAGFDSFVCPNNAQNVRYGLSAHIAARANADRLCPAGTWLCTRAQVETGAVGCDTSRPDSASCDYRTCDGTCVSLPSDNHLGWTSSFSDGTGTIGVFKSELGFLSVGDTCLELPAWCCSRL
jgi:hypothetical protein